MKKVIAVALFFVVAMTVMASGGVLNRPGNAISVGDLGSAGCFSVFGPALDQQQGVLEIGIVGLATDFAYNRDGALGGGHFDAKKEVFPFPYGNIAYRWNKATLALSSNVPYGLATDYSENLGFRSEMIFANATTSIGYELNEQLFLGAGLRTVYSKVAFEMPLYAERVYLGQTSTNLDGYGCGLSLEAKLNMNDGLEMALVYEPAIKVRVAGNTEFPAIIGLASDEVRTEIYSPERRGLGIKCDATNKIKLGATYLITNYRDNDTVVLDYATLPNSNLSLGWGVVRSIHGGMEYRPDKHLILRTGLGWMSGGTPDYSPPSIPDGDGWIITSGISLKISQQTAVDIGLGYFWADRKIPPEPQNISAGDLSLQGYMVGLGLVRYF